MRNEESLDKQIMAEAAKDGSKNSRVRSMIATIEEDYFFCDGMLHDAVGTALEDWTVSDLEAVDCMTLIRLCLTLKQRGVYVAKRAPEGSQAQALLDAIKTEEPLEWPENSVEKFAKRTQMLTRNHDLLRRIPIERVHPDLRPYARDEVLSLHMPTLTTLATSSDTITSTSPTSPTTSTSLTILTTPTTPTTSSTSTSLTTPTTPTAPAPLPPPQQQQQPDPAPPRPRAGSPVNDLIYRGADTESVDHEEQRRILRYIYKHYPAECKYKGSADSRSLERCAKNFLGHCSDVGLHEAYLVRAISSMMGLGQVYDDCADIRRTTDDWRMLLGGMFELYETPVIVKSRIDKWNDLWLPDVASYGKPLSDTVQEFYKTIARDHSSLPATHNTPEVLYSCLLTAYQSYRETSDFADKAAAIAKTPVPLYTLIYDYAK
ncbi:hypothetical protein SEPCBS57363_006808, partial [Sporothrix epigloea]